jgi:acetoacetyl-CoA synthetase
MSSALWYPSQDRVKNSAISKLSGGLSITDYNQLHQWSINNLDRFWSTVWDQGNIIGFKGKDIFTPHPNFISAKFFPQAKLNVAENLLTNNLGSEIAITSLSESAQKIEISWSALRLEVAKVAAAMSDLGVKSGDRVVAWTPNTHQVIIFTIAALSIGAVISTASTDFAAPAVLDRFSQIGPKILLAGTSYQYNGKKINGQDSLDQIVHGLPSLAKVIVINQESTKYQNWDNWLLPYSGAELKYERFGFDHPGFILFSSGTTGKPKCIVHRAAGILMKLTAEHLFNFDLSEEDKVFFYTTTGWMMWNWLLYVLASSTSIVLYDGSPTYPRVDNLLQIAADEKCTHLGLSAKYIDLLNKSEIKNDGKYELLNLKAIISTGSVLSAEGFNYIYKNIKSDLHLASISGGTDICGCFVSAVPTLPVYAGEIQGACLGMAVDVFDEKGKSLSIDQKGELVCTKPFPSMPIGFWNDDKYSNYLNSYFSKFDGIWTHGDFASKSINSGFVIHGRSDATLNSKGVRIGTAEIYRVVEQLGEVIESLAVAKVIESDSKVILFVVLKSGYLLTDELKQQIMGDLRTQASPRHVPDLIIQAPELPKTKSNKLVELAVSDLINGRSVRNRDGLLNPAALDWFAALDLDTLI